MSKNKDKPRNKKKSPIKLNLLEQFFVFAGLLGVVFLLMDFVAWFVSYMGMKSLLLSIIMVRAVRITSFMGQAGFGLAFVLSVIIARRMPNERDE